MAKTASKSVEPTPKYHLCDLVINTARDDFPVPDTGVAYSLDEVAQVLSSSIDLVASFGKPVTSLCLSLVPSGA